MRETNIEQRLLDALQEACRLLECNVAVLYHLDRTRGYSPVLWTPSPRNIVPPHLSSASDVSAFLRTCGQSPFSLRADSFRDVAMRKGFAAFEIAELLVHPIASKESGTYLLTFGLQELSSMKLPEQSQEAIDRIGALMRELADAILLKTQTISLVDFADEEKGTYNATNLHLLQTILAEESFGALVNLLADHFPDIANITIEDKNGHVLIALRESTRARQTASPFMRLVHLDLSEQSHLSLEMPASFYPLEHPKEGIASTDDYGLMVPLYGGDEFLGLLTLHGISLSLINANRSLIATAAFAATYLIRSQQATRGHTLQKALTSVENERRHMAIDLHDETSQNLVALNVHLATAQRAFELQRIEDAVRLLEDCQCITDNILTEVNRLSSELSSSELTYLGLQSAIDGEAQKRLPKAGITYRLSGNALGLRFNALQEAMLLKGVVEAISNCVRHAQATKVAITLEDDGTWFTIEVADNGIGFDDVSVRPAGTSATYGLKTMYDCAEALGGTFWIGSSPGEGTTVRFSIPVNLLEEDVRG